MSNTYDKDRDEVLLSLDEKKIRAFCRKYDLLLSDNPLVFWASVYKSILLMDNPPDKIRKKAEEWLDSHEFQRGIGPYEEEEPETQERPPRHTFEHVIFPIEFYKCGETIMKQIVDGDRFYMADLYNNLDCDDQPFKAKQFKIVPRKYESQEETIRIVRLDLPRPVQILECRRIYLCYNELSKDLMYFTSELSAEGSYYLCAWTKKHSHIWMASDPHLSEFDCVAGWFRKLAGHELPIVVSN